MYADQMTLHSSHGYPCRSFVSYVSLICYGSRLAAALPIHPPTCQQVGAARPADHSTRRALPKSHRLHACVIAVRRSFIRRCARRHRACSQPGSPHMLNYSEFYAHECYTRDSYDCLYPAVPTTYPSHVQCRLLPTPSTISSCISL